MKIEKILIDPISGEVNGLNTFDTITDLAIKINEIIERINIK